MKHRLTAVDHRDQLARVEQRLPVGRSARLQLTLEHREIAVASAAAAAVQTQPTRRHVFTDLPLKVGQLTLLGGSQPTAAHSGRDPGGAVSASSPNLRSNSFRVPTVVATAGTELAYERFVLRDERDVPILQLGEHRCA